MLKDLNLIDEAILQLEALQERWFIRLFAPLAIEPILEDLYNYKRAVEDF